MNVTVWFPFLPVFLSRSNAKKILFVVDQCGRGNFIYISFSFFSLLNQCLKRVFRFLFLCAPTVLTRTGKVKRSPGREKEMFIDQKIRRYAQAFHSCLGFI